MESEERNSSHSIIGQVKQSINLYDNLFAALPDKTPEQMLKKEISPYYLILLPNQKLIRLIMTKDDETIDFPINKSNFKKINHKLKDKKCKKTLDIFLLVMEDSLKYFDQIFSLDDDKKRIFDVENKIRIKKGKPILKEKKKEPMIKGTSKPTKTKKQSNPTVSSKEEQLNLF